MAGWWFQIFFSFHPENWGRWTHFDDHIFQIGWFNHQPDGFDIFFHAEIVSDFLFVKVGMEELLRLLRLLMEENPKQPPRMYKTM